MAIVTEDGTGKADSETYISVADASTYFSERGNTTWAAIASDALREAALRKGTEYMVSTCRSRWQGCRTTPTVQALDWPRVGVVVDGVYVDSDEIPTEVERACAEFALRASSADLQADLTQGRIKEKVGPIDVTYDKSSPQQKRYKSLDAMLSPFLRGGGGAANISLIRA